MGSTSPVNLSHPDRRRPSAIDVLPIAMLVLQLIAIVWAASAFKSQMEQFRIATKEWQVDMTTTVHTIETTTTNLSIDVGILKGQSVKK